MEENKITNLLIEVRDARRLLGKVVPKDQNDMIKWAVKSGDSVYTNAGAAFRTLDKALRAYDKS